MSVNRLALILLQVKDVIYIHYTSEVSQCFVFQPMSMRKSPKAMNLCVVNQSPTCEYYHRFNAHEIPQVHEGPVYFPP